MKTNKAVKINANMVGVEVMNIQDAENAARRLYDLGACALENGELESVSFDVEEKEGE